MAKIGIIGGGNMGEAIIVGSLKKFFVSVCEKDVSRQKYLLKNYKIPSYDLKKLSEISDIMILAVKPQDFDEVLKELAPSLQKKTLVISIAAGITTRYIERRLGKNIRVVRAMPNLPALIQRGVTAISKGRFAKTSDLNSAKKIFDHIGSTVIVKEGSINAITAVSGSGPAYVFLFMECLIAAAEDLGLSKDLALKLVRRTFSGSIALVEKKNIDPADLRVKVTSKGGTTQAAMDVFEKQQLNKIIKAAVQAAAKRAKQLLKK